LINFSALKDRSLFSVVFRTLIVLFSYGYNKETCKIIEATFLTLHFLPYARFFRKSMRGRGMDQATQW